MLDLNQYDIKMDPIYFFNAVHELVMHIIYKKYAYTILS